MISSYKLIQYFCIIILLPVISSLRGNYEPLREYGNCTEPNEFLVYLYYTDIYKYYYCVGTLLNPYWILSSAQCLLIKGPIHVLAGISTQKRTSAKNTQHRIIHRSYVHPDYVENKFPQPDIGLGYIMEAIKEGPNIKYVKLPSFRSNKHVNEICNKVTAMGWGRWDTKYKASEYLQCRDLEVVPQSQCSSFYYSYDTGFEMCTHTDDYLECQGDGGGPLICNGVQHGLVCVSLGCTFRKPLGRNIWVKPFLGFIRDAMRFRISPRSASRGDNGEAAYMFITGAAFMMLIIIY